MKLKINKACLLTFLILSLFACTKKYYPLSSYYYYETECLGNELDGSNTVRAWGTGKNKSDALEQAQKNAVRDILFKGLRGGSRECETKPLVLETNACEEHKDYFDRFFSDDGLYKLYVSNEDIKKGSSISKKNKSQLQYSVIVRIKTPELRQQLEKDKIVY